MVQYCMSAGDPFLREKGFVDRTEQLNTTGEGNIIGSWENRFRLMADNFRAENVAKVCRNSEEYQRLIKEEKESYERIASLGLTEEQREVVEQAYEAQSATDAEYAAESYFCGIADCLRFLDYMKERQTE